MTAYKERRTAHGQRGTVHGTVLRAPLAVLFLATMLCRCGNMEPDDCSLAICSEQFNTVMLSVKYTDGSPVILDTFRLTHAPDESPIRLSVLPEDFERMRIAGQYPVLNDLFVPSRENTQMEITFTAVFKNEEITQNVRVSIDCCHVTPIGDSSITLPLPTPDECNAPCSSPRDTLWLRLKYPDNTPVALDTFHLATAWNNAPVAKNFSTDEWETMRTTGAYPMIDDSFVPGRENTRAAIRFAGFKDNRTIIDTIIIVDIDCCNASFFSGNGEITVPPPGARAHALL